MTSKLNTESKFIVLSGVRVYLNCINRKSFYIEGVARRLSQMYRFNADVKYSVAEHCLLVDDLLRVRGEPIEVRYYGLLHELDEAAGVGDICTQIKHTFFTKDTQSRLDGYRNKLNKAYNIPTTLPQCIHDVDYEAFVLEVQRFFGGEGLALYDVAEDYRLVYEKYTNILYKPGSKISVPEIFFKLDDQIRQQSYDGHSICIQQLFLMRYYHYRTELGLEV